MLPRVGNSKVVVYNPYFVAKLKTTLTSTRNIDVFSEETSLE